MSDSSRDSIAERVQHFIKWFSALEPEDQDVLMTMVHREKKVRDVVNSLGGMGLEQRREVFERLGLPADLVSRIPAPEPYSQRCRSGMGGLESAWQLRSPSFAGAEISQHIAQLQ